MKKPVEIFVGDVRDGLRQIADGSVHCCVTSPPYWGLRDYGTASWDGGDPACDHARFLGGNGASSAKQVTSGGTQKYQYRDECAKCGAKRVDNQIGLESSPDAYVAAMVEVFREVRRCLRDDGVMFLNIGDSYTGNAASGGAGKQDTNCRIENVQTKPGKPKDLCMIPWRVALALQADGWYLRSVIVWAKKSPMPESVTDRPTSSWEPIFLLTKNATYFYDAEAVKEPLADTNAQRTTSHYDTSERYGVGNGGNNGLDGLAARMREGNHTARNQRNVWTLGPEPFSGWTETVHWERVEAGVDGDDIRRTESADCPVHGCLGSRRCGEREAAPLNGIDGTDGRPGQERTPERCASSQSLDASSAVCSSDSTPPPCSPPATSRSSRTRKTGLALSTTGPCTPSAQTSIGTPGTSETPASSVPSLDTPESRPSEDCAGGATGSDPSGQTTSSSVDICTCQHHRRVTKKIDHFATFPTEIPRRAIKAGTSEKGCCPECGAPWARVVEKSPNNNGYASGSGGRHKEYEPHHGSLSDAARWDSKTLRWEPSCRCRLPNTIDAVPWSPVPCLVLDPFLGSGTTIAVARTLGRHGVGCELNPAYAELARERIGKAERPHTYRSDKVEAGGLFA